MRGKTTFLLVCSILLIGAFLISGYYNLMPAISTDAGFDVDFDTGGSSGSSSGSGDIFSIIYLMLQYPLLTLILVIVFILFSVIENNKKRNKDGSNFNNITQSSYDEETKEFLLTAYQIFYDVQMSWMNFDYDKLKTLVTDELYNSYYNQLQTLELKGQKNIMRDFIVKSSRILSNKQDAEKIMVVVELNVSFYDYIVDASNNVLRGKDTQKVSMTYHLTFVAQLNSNDKCPNCGAPLETPSYCDYCKSHIQGLSTGMRMSKKEAIRQRME